MKNTSRSLVVAIVVILVAGAAHRVTAQDARPPADTQKRLDWPSITAAAIGQIVGDGGTTVYFLTGHGQSASHPGPCVEANPLFQPSTHQIAKIMVTKVALVGGLVAFNYLAEHWRAPESAKTVRWVSRGLNYFAAGEGALATVHNIGHCGI